MRKIVIVAVWLALGAGAAAAQEAPATTTPCWDIVVPYSSAEQKEPILIDRCTGSTWLLTTDYLTDSGARGPFTYRWLQLRMKPTEPIFVNPSAQPPAQ